MDGAENARKVALAATAECRMGQQDILMKQLMMPERSQTFGILTGQKVSEALDKSLRITRELHTDNLVKLQDGSILHVEYQYKSDPTMPWRMARYKFLMLLKEGDDKGESLPLVRQIVFYVGNASHRMASSFSHDGVELEFEVRDLRGAFNNGQDLIRSDCPEDWILALLCMQRPDKHDKEAWSAYARAWSSVSVRLSRLPDLTKRSDCFVLLDMAAATREIPAGHIQRPLQMPLNVDLENTVYAKQIFQDGQRKLMLDGIRHRCVEANVVFDENTWDSLTALDDQVLKAVYEATVYRREQLNVAYRRIMKEHRERGSGGPVLGDD